MMKHTLLLLPAIFLFSLFAAAQDSTHVVKNTKDGKLFEDYYRNSSGNKTGIYKRYSRNGKPIIVGQYHDGIPVGTWQYFSADTSATLVEKLDMDNHTVLYRDMKRAPGAICGPRYFGGNMIEQEYIALHVNNDFTADEKKKYSGQSFVVSFVIDSTSLHPVLINITNDEIPVTFRNKLVKIVSDMPAWLPPACDESDKTWNFSVTVKFE